LGEDLVRLIVASGVGLLIARDLSRRGKLDDSPVCVNGVEHEPRPSDDGVDWPPPGASFVIRARQKASRRYFGWTNVGVAAGIVCLTPVVMLRFIPRLLVTGLAAG
jgi:hypothetical protein